jgi:multiple sugar transport system permease protein
VIFILLLVGTPFVLAIYLSFTDATAGSLSGNWVGMQNFVTEWHNPIFRHALRNTAVMTLMSQAIVVVCAAILANYLAKPFRGRWFLRFLILLPWAAPVALGAITWLWIYDSLYSVINWVLVHGHLIGPACAVLHRWPFRVGQCTTLDVPQWLGQPNLAMASIITVQAWRVLPFAVVIFLAGHASIPQEVEDAAKVDGATGIKRLIYVTLPLQLPIALVAILFGLVFTATDMAVVYILTNGGPFNSTQVITTWAFQQGIQGGSLGEGAAVSLFLLPVLAIVAIAMLFFARRAEVA